MKTLTTLVLLSVWIQIALLIVLALGWISELARYPDIVLTATVLVGAVAASGAVLMFGLRRFPSMLFLIHSGVVIYALSRSVFSFDMQVLLAVLLASMLLVGMVVMPSQRKRRVVVSVSDSSPVSSSSDQLLVASHNGGRVHLAGCVVAQRIPKDNRVSFANQQQAAKKGYLPCRLCLLSK